MVVNEYIRAGIAARSNVVDSEMELNAEWTRRGVRITEKGDESRPGTEGPGRNDTSDDSGSVAVKIVKLNLLLLCICCIVLRDWRAEIWHHSSLRTLT